MAIWRCWLMTLLFLSVSAVAEECSAIWPSAVTENSSIPAAVSYSPPTTTTINNFNRTLPPGDFVIGTSSVPNNTTLRTNSATTRIFVNGNLVLNNSVMFNASGAPENLLIVVTGSLSVFNNSVIRGFVLVGGAVFFSNNASINGGLTAKGSISGWNNSNATYNASALSRLDGGVVCNGQPAVEEIDHFEFSYSGQALTCKAETFTIKACKDAACSELITSNVSATLSPATGWVSGTGLSGNTINFSGGTATATLSQTTAATIQVGVSASTPSLKPASTTLCQIGTSLSAANCYVVFASSGLVFSVPDKLAGKPATNIAVKAVKSNGTQQCVPSFSNVTRTVKFWSTFNNPTSPSASPARAVTVLSDGASINIGTSAGASTAMALSFDSNGEANIGVNYSDAGQVTLNALYTGSAATNDLNLSMSGADSFVSAPAGLCITPQQSCATADATCPGYVKAGDAFPLDIKAVGWQSDTDTNFCDNTTTPSFQLNGISLASTLLQPSGGNNGSLSPTSYNHNAQASATTTLSNVSQTEVGVFNIAASYSGAYLGMPVNLTSSMPSALGRIVPHHFSLISHSLPAACTNFSYFEQPTLLNLTLQAQNATGNTVQNYRAAFAKATATLVAENNNDGVNRSSRLNNQSNLLIWNNGEAQLTNSAVYMTRDTTPDGPFSQLRIGLLLNDNDDLDVQLQGLDQRVDASTNCSVAGDCASKMLTAADLDWRYGRLQIVNSVGSEQSNLPVQLKAEYWNGSQFVPNGLDSCSVITPTKLSITPGSYPLITASGNTTTLQQGSSAAFDLLLSAPGVESRYPLQYQLSDQPWLQYDWTPGDTTLLENPTGEAVFGGFRGNNRQIYWQEN